MIWVSYNADATPVAVIIVKSICIHIMTVHQLPLFSGRADVSSLTSRVYTLLLHLQKKCNTYIASGQDFHLFIPMVDYSFSDTFIPPQKKNTACFTYYILDLRCKRHIKSNFK